MSRTTASASPAAPGTELAPEPVATEPQPERARRADAQRNHDLILATAAEVYAERGPEASLEEIARRAGVGIGTLYRHFPNRDVLTEAVYRRDLESLCDGADELLAEHPAGEALTLWMHRFAAYIGRKKGMAMALKAFLGSDAELFTYSARRVREALATLIAAAVDAGAVPPDTDGEDLLRAMSGICMAGNAAAASAPAEVARTSRLVDLLVDGLRYRAAGPGR